MNSQEIEGLIGMLTTFGILVLLALPSLLGVLRDRRVDRRIRRARRTDPAPGPGRHGPAGRARAA